MEVQRSLSRAIVALGDAGSAAVDRILAGKPSEAARMHALATQRLLADPDEGFEAAVFAAKRVVSLRNAPTVAGGSAAGTVE